MEKIVKKECDTKRMRLGKCYCSLVTWKAPGVVSGADDGLSDKVLVSDTLTLDKY